jgi:hypothetical protein
MLNMAISPDFGRVVSAGQFSMAKSADRLRPGSIRDSAATMALISLAADQINHFRWIFPLVVEQASCLPRNGSMSCTHRHSPSLRPSVQLFLFLTISLVGCGSDDSGLLPVSGQVFYDGQPLTTGTVSLHPTEATGHVPTGVINAEGRYTLSTNYQPGAPPGQYRVVVHATEPIVPIPGKAHPGLPKSLIPARYNQSSTSPLDVEVKPDAPADAYDLRLEK